MLKHDHTVLIHGQRVAIDTGGHVVVVKEYDGRPRMHEQTWIGDTGFDDGAIERQVAAPRHALHAPHANAECKAHSAFFIRLYCFACV